MSTDEVESPAATLSIVLERMKLAVNSLVELHNRMLNEDAKVTHVEELNNIIKRMNIPKTQIDR